jgi:hypothetical protein
LAGDANGSTADEDDDPSRLNLGAMLRELPRTSDGFPMT